MAQHDIEQVMRGVASFVAIIVSEVKSGRSYHWDMPFEWYVEERMGDLDFFGMIGDPEIADEDDDNDPGRLLHRLAKKAVFEELVKGDLKRVFEEVQKRR